MRQQGRLRVRHGRRALGISKDDQILASSGFVAGGDGKPAIVMPGPDYTAIFEDFYAGVGADLNGDTGTAGRHFITRKGDTGTRSRSLPPLR